MNAVKRMFVKRNLLRQFVMNLTSCYVDGEGDAGSSVSVETAPEGVPANEEDDKEPIEPIIPKDLVDYVGSKEVNPEQRPLKNFDRRDFRNKEELDRFIQEAGAELIMSDEDIAAMKAAAKDKPKEDKKPATERDENGKFKKADASEEVSEEDATKIFFEKAGIDPEEFAALPEKIQEKLVESYSKDSDVDVRVKQVETEYAQLKTALDSIEKDPVIAARLQEIATPGKSYVAKDLPAPSKTELAALMEAANDEDTFKAALAEFIAEKAEEVISIERSVVERRFAREKLESEAMAVVSEMVQKEARIGIKEKDIAKIDDKHPDFQAWKGEKGLFKFFKDHKLSLAQIKDMGSEKLLALLQKDRGWDKERDQKVYQQGAKALLAKIKEAKNKARTIDMGKKSAQPNSEHSSGGFDRNSLVAEIASGSLTQWERLLEKADQRGDKTMMNELFTIRDEAQKENARKHRPSDY